MQGQVSPPPKVTKTDVNFDRLYRKYTDPNWREIMNLWVEKEFPSVTQFKRFLAEKHPHLDYSYQMLTMFLKKENKGDIMRIYNEAQAISKSKVSAVQIHDDSLTINQPDNTLDLLSQQSGIIGSFHKYITKYGNEMLISDSNVIAAMDKDEYERHDREREFFLKTVALHKANSQFYASMLQNSADLEYELIVLKEIINTLYQFIPIPDRPEAERQVKQIYAKYTTHPILEAEAEIS